MSVGTSVRRADGVAKVTGKATYVDDLRPEGCWYGATVRSRIAHGVFRGLERDPSFDWSDVVVVTAADIPGKNHIHLMTDDQPALADGLIRHTMEPVALVAAPSRDKALAAVKHLRVLEDEQTPLLDPLVSEGNALRIFGEDNVFKRIAIDKGERGRAEKVPGAVVHSGRYRVGLQEQLYIEPQGMLCVPESDGSLLLIGSMQCPFYIEKALLPLLGHKNFRVVQAATGGGFGGKEEYPSMVAAHAALLALKTGRPIKLIYRRDEDLRATTKRHPAVIDVRSVTAADGTLLEWDVKMVVDGGAYNTLTPVVMSRAILHATGPYRCPDVHLLGTAVATHTPPNGAFRGFGAPQAMFAAERHMDRIARGLGLDPVAFRRHNLLREGDLTATNQTLTDPAAFLVMDQALEAALVPVPPGEVHDGGGRGNYARGRGVAMVFHGCGFTGNGEAFLKGRAGLELRGGAVHLLTSSTDIGQGAETTLAQIAATELGIGVQRVVVDPHDTGAVPDSGPTVASRTCMVVGGVVQKCAVALRKALQAETGREDTDFDALVAARARPVPLRVEVQYEDDGTHPWDPELYQGDAYPTYGWNCTVVDLDVDLDTGEVLYRRLVSSTDVGKAINPVIVTGQIEGGALQALGYATSEEVVLDKHGCMRNDRLTDYIIPTSADAPDMVTLIVEVPYAGGPFGAKGIGEIPMDGPAAAVAQAIEQATGAVLDVLPMTPERVLLAVESLGAA